MKKVIQRQIIMCSKFVMYGIFIQTLLFSALVASNGNAQNSKKILSVREANISIQLESAGIVEIFKAIEKSSDYKFFYDRKFIDNKVKLDISVLNEPLSDILLQISQKAGLKFRQVNETINVSKKVSQAENSIEIYDLTGQGITITGKVTASDSPEGLPGVNVVVKGTTRGSVTDIDGNYLIEIPSTESILVYSSVGYASQEVVVGNRTVINLTLSPDVKALEEIVVIGYGKRERKDITGAISQIGSDQITKQPSMSPEFAMQGRMAGVFVSNPGSNPTARPEIRIRGVGTLGFNDPLYVIDGIPITEGGANNQGGRVNDLRSPINIFSMINPNDIESISVLKDASATAIYGVRAANGVVLITTKRGGAGKAKVDVTTSFGVQNIYKTHDMVNTSDYIMLSQEAFANANFTPAAAINALFTESNPANLLSAETYTQDWQDAARVKNAKVQDYNISISGGTNRSNFMVGGGFSDQEDAVFYSRFKRYSLSVNSDHKLTDWLKVGETYRVVYSQQKNEAGPSDLGSFVAPWQPLYDNTENGLLGYARTNRTINNSNQSRGYGDGTQNNFLALANLNETQFNIFRNLGSVYAEATLLKGLRVRGTYSIDYYTNNRQVFQDQRQGLFQGTIGRIQTDLGNTYARREGENLNLVGEILVGYNQKFGEHSIDVILNAMDQRYFWNNMQQAISSDSPLAPDWEQRRIEEGWFPDDKGTFYERNRYGLQGYMGRLSYNYASKYYIDATVRRDGSSRFGPGFKWGTFPSVAGAWRISAESFMQNVPSLSDLKLRGGWGRIGNQETQDFAFLSSINVNPKTSFGTNPASAGNGIVQYAAALYNLPTAELSWEIVTTTNFGFDSEWFNSKLRISGEYYNRFTDGILQNIELPGVVGIVPQPVVNLAQVTNRGVEFDVQYNNRIGDLGYNLGFNLTTVRNRVEKIYNNAPRGGNSDRIEVGKPINFFWGLQTDGIIQTQEEADAYNAEIKHAGAANSNKAPGDVKFVDIGRAPTGEESGQGVWQILEADGIINNFDHTYLGKQIPGYYGGLNIGGDYKGFDLYINFRYTGDVQKVYRHGKESIGGANLNFVSAYLNRWTPENPSTTVPRALHNNRALSNAFQDRYIEDAGFLRFQNFQLGYSLNQSILSKTGINNLRLYLSGTNLFVLTPFGDLDPENITTPTTFTVGANLSF